MKIKIKNKDFNVKIVTSIEERSEGMMFKRFSENINGMLFIMEKNEEQRFWMKNCLISLDILFISNNIITKIHHNCPPCNEDDCITYNGVGNIVLELLGGSCKDNNIKIGDKVAFFKKSL